MSRDPLAQHMVAAGQMDCQTTVFIGFETPCCRMLPASWV
jgi:hypothetical protein